MPTATVTSKGQITVPKEVREALRLGAGDRLSFLIREDGVVELRPQTVDLNDLVGILRVQGKRMTVEQMNDAIRRAAAKR